MWIGDYEEIKKDAVQGVVKAMDPVALNPDARYFLSYSGESSANLMDERRLGLPVDELIDDAARDRLADPQACEHCPIEPGDVVAVLNYGFVEFMDCMGSDDDIADAARTSYTGGKKAQANASLIRYLLRHQHTTPFEMGELKFRVYIPIFVYRQMFRHRTANQLEPEVSEAITNDTAFQTYSVQNEMSGRYVEMPDHYYIPEAASIQKQSDTNKQGRADGGFSPEEQAGIQYRLSDEVKAMRSWYQASTQQGVAKELARVNLPLSQYTLLIWKIDLKNLMHFCALRLHPHAQFEVREYARALMAVVKSRFPITAEAFEDYVINAERFTREEVRALRDTMSTEQRVAVWHMFAARVKNSRERAEFAAKLGLPSVPERE